jgi:hypothetical protein
MTIIQSHSRHANKTKQKIYKLGIAITADGISHLQPAKVCIIIQHRSPKGTSDSAPNDYHLAT